MRGTVITWSGDKGVVTAGGQRYDFDINHWQGAVAPAAEHDGRGRDLGRQA